MLGAAWTATALTVLRTPPGGTSTSLGIFLLTLAATMLVLSAGALRSKPLFGVLLMLGACRFGLTGMYEAGIGGTVTELASGWIGVPLVAFSMYGGLALLLEDGAQRTVLPVTICAAVAKMESITRVHDPAAHGRSTAADG